MKTNSSSSRLICIGADEPRGSYVLRIAVHDHLSMKCGRFKRGKLITVPPGEYLYVGSAMAKQGSTCLARRLLRHASRSEEKTAHSIRKTMLGQFPKMGLSDLALKAPASKTLRWNVDHLLDRPEVELVAAYLIRCPVELEPAIGDMLEDDAHTKVIQKGLGANDRPGSTCLLRVDAEEVWWHKLRARLTSLRKKALPDPITHQCLERDGDDGVRPKKAPTKKKWVADTTQKVDIKLGEAVAQLIANCGESARHVLFDPKHPQTPNAILKLSRTADTRQQYRIQGVLEGRFRSIAPQSCDCVFDTVAFYEVPSRLARARGALQKLKMQFDSSVEPNVKVEVRRLARICRQAARQLRMFVKASKVAQRDIPKQLTKAELWPGLRARDVTGQKVGLARLALRLTIKCVWDYPEMWRRRLVPSEKENARTLNEIDQMVMAIKSLR